MQNWDFWYPILQNGVGGSCTGFAIAGLFWMNMTHFKMLRWDRTCYLWTGQIVTIFSFFLAGLYYAHVHVPLADRDITELLVLGFLFFGSAIPALVTAASSASLLIHQIKQIKTFALIVGIGLPTVGYLVTVLCVSLFVSGGAGTRLLIRVVAIPLIMEAQLGLVRVLARRHFQPDMNLDRALLFMSPTIVTAGIVGQLLSTSFETLGETIGAALLLGAVEMLMRLTTLQRDQLYMRVCGTRCSALCGRGDLEGEGKQRSGASAPGEWRLFASYILLDSAAQDVGIVLSLAVNLMFRPPVTPGGASLSSGEVLLRVSIQYLLELLTEMAMPLALWCAVRVGGMRQWRVSQQQVQSWGHRRSQRWLAAPAQSPAARYRPAQVPLATAAEQDDTSCSHRGRRCCQGTAASCTGGTSTAERDEYFWSCSSLCPHADARAVQQTAAEIWVEQRIDRDALHDAVWLQPTLGVLGAMSQQPDELDAESGSPPAQQCPLGSPSQLATATPLTHGSMGDMQLDGGGAEKATEYGGGDSPYCMVRSDSTSSSGSTAPLHAPSPDSKAQIDSSTTSYWDRTHGSAPQLDLPASQAQASGAPAQLSDRSAAPDLAITAGGRDPTHQSMAPDPSLIYGSLRARDDSAPSARGGGLLPQGRTQVMPAKERGAPADIGDSQGSAVLVQHKKDGTQACLPPPGDSAPSARKLHPSAAGLLDDTPGASKLPQSAAELLDDTPSANKDTSAVALPAHLPPPHVGALIQGSRSPHGPRFTAAAGEPQLEPVPVSRAQALLVQLELASVRLIRAWDTRFPFFDFTFVVTAFSMTTWLLMSVLFTKQCPYGDPGQPETWRFDVCQDFV